MEGCALVKTLAIGLAALWATSLVTCVILFWPVLKFECWRARQQGEAAKLKSTSQGLPERRAGNSVAAL